MSRKRRCRFLWLFLFWGAFTPWFVYSYLFGDNSLFTYEALKLSHSKLLREKKFWEEKNEILKEKIEAFKRNKKFYYHKLAREMFVKGKKGEEVILFVK